MKEIRKLEIGKKLEIFNNSFTAYNKAKSSTGVATTTINPDKTKATTAAPISISPRNTSRANACVEDDGGISSYQEEATDTRKGKRKRVKIFNMNKKVVRETGDSHPSTEDELSLYSGSDLEEQIDRLRDITNSQVNFANNIDGSKPEESSEGNLIKDITDDFSAVGKTGPPIAKSLASIINELMFNPVNRGKLV